jgi:hypothetical protein
MNHLFSMVLVLVLVPQSQNLPDAFHQLPEQVREKATVIVTGTYREGRSPCIYIGDGTRVWALESRFHIKTVYQGEVGGKSIYVNTRMSPKINGVSVKLKVGSDYLVLLRPNEESMKIIKSGEYVPVWDALEGEELIAIVELISLLDSFKQFSTQGRIRHRRGLRGLSLYEWSQPCKAGKY